MANLILHSKLREELLDVEFLKATQSQIAKDFRIVNSSFVDSFKEDVCNFEELLDQVSLNLAEQLKLGERQTLQLMYRIDIPENDFLTLATERQFVFKLAERIILREAYKIYLRKKFSP